jgi:Zinc knuckle
MALVKATLGPMGGGNITTRQNRLRTVQNPTKMGGTKRKDPDAMEVNTVRTETARANRLSDEEQQQLLKEGRCFNCKKLGHMMRTCPDKQRTNGSTNNWQGGQTTTPSCPAQGTSHTRAAIINEDEEDTKEEKGKEKEDAPPAYKPESLIEHIK